MHLYLMRHGEAGIEIGVTDSQRSLTLLGEKQAQQQADYLAQQKMSIQQIYHSDYLRAQQTAEIVGHSLNNTKVEAHTGLRPQDSIDSLVLEINTWQNNILLVGHLPYLALLALELTDNYVDFHPATLAILEKTAQKWQLVSVNHSGVE